jgi:hypothetical protein
MSRTVTVSPRPARLVTAHGSFVSTLTGFAAGRGLAPPRRNITSHPGEQNEQDNRRRDSANSVHPGTAQVGNSR